MPKDNLGRGAIDEARALTGDIGACVERMCAIKEIEYEDDGKKVQPIARMLARREEVRTPSRGANRTTEEGGIGSLSR